MAIREGSAISINVIGAQKEVVSKYLRVFLAMQKLTDKQLEVATSLVVRYSMYVLDGVSEPYASTILFSTEVRKEISTELSISSAHLNNTITQLIKKGVLGKEDGKKRYTMNPHLVPTSKLIFNFKIDGRKA